MRRLTAILNPQSDRGRTALLAEQMQQALAGRVELQLLKTTCRGEAIELAQQAAAAGCDGVVAIGGDGTVHEVANGLLAIDAATRPPLGVIPAGSGNDFAFALGIEKNLSRNVELLAGGLTRAVDAALVETATGRRRYSINNLGALLEGEINLASHRLTWPRGSGLYLRAALQTLVRRPPIARLQLTVDGQRHTRESAILSISNGCRSGGKFYLMPDAKIDDGRFDYLVARPATRLRMLWEIYRSLGRERAASAWAEQGEFASMTVESDLPLAAHVDGEPWLRPEEGERELTLTVLPRVLLVFAPAG
ncbi:diacylglycerol/lipid kinase family protein [Lacipirellula sp.]|uniref:diacylglycerol/lipid kinase family protein n=1 Tax=Lacipirellula sp. TaxID=2691419 RepID=UPI003D0B4119